MIRCRDSCRYSWWPTSDAPNSHKKNLLQHTELHDSRSNNAPKQTEKKKQHKNGPCFFSWRCKGMEAWIDNWNVWTVHKLIGCMRDVHHENAHTDSHTRKRYSQWMQKCQLRIHSTDFSALFSFFLLFFVRFFLWVYCIACKVTHKLNVRTLCIFST